MLSSVVSGMRVSCGILVLPLVALLTLAYPRRRIYEAGHTGVEV